MRRYAVHALNGEELSIDENNLVPCKGNVIDVGTDGHLRSSRDVNKEKESVEIE